MLQDSVTYTDFINKELVQFAKYDETPALVAALIHPDSVGRTMKLDNKIMRYNIANQYQSISCTIILRTMV